MTCSQMCDGKVDVLYLQTVKNSQTDKIAVGACHAL